MRALLIVIGGCEILTSAIVGNLFYSKEKPRDKYQRVFGSTKLINAAAKNLTERNLLFSVQTSLRLTLRC